MCITVQRRRLEAYPLSSYVQSDGGVLRVGLLAVVVWAVCQFYFRPFLIVLETALDQNLIESRLSPIVLQINNFRPFFMCLRLPSIRVSSLNFSLSPIVLQTSGIHRNESLYCSSCINVHLRTIEPPAHRGPSLPALVRPFQFILCIQPASLTPTSLTFSASLSFAPRSVFLHFGSYLQSISPSSTHDFCAAMSTTRTNSESTTPASMSTTQSSDFRPGKVLKTRSLSLAVPRLEKPTARQLAARKAVDKRHARRLRRPQPSLDSDEFRKAWPCKLLRFYPNPKKPVSAGPMAPPDGRSARLRGLLEKHPRPLVCAEQRRSEPEEARQNWERLTSAAALATARYCFGPRARELPGVKETGEGTLPSIMCSGITKGHEPAWFHDCLPAEASSGSSSSSEGDPDAAYLDARAVYRAALGTFNVVQTRAINAQMVVNLAQRALNRAQQAYRDAQADFEVARATFADAKAAWTHAEYAYKRHGGR